MVQLESALLSPRIQNGVICWYEGDEFSISLTLNLTDADGTDVAVQNGDTVKISFFDERKEEIKAFEFTAVENNTVTMVFNADVSALFKQGKYKYDIVLDSDNITTLAKGNDVLVE